MQGINLQGEANGGLPIQKIPYSMGREQGSENHLVNPKLLCDKIGSKKELTDFLELDADLYVHDVKYSNRHYLKAVIRKTKNVSKNKQYSNDLISNKQQVLKHGDVVKRREAGIKGLTITKLLEFLRK